MSQRRFNIRMSEQIASQIDTLCIETGLYESASEYFRDITRHDLARREEENLQKIGDILEPLLGRPFEECEPFEPKKDLEEMTKRYLAKKEAE